jgi:DNA-binding SARP family transcriptional activator/tetratricopeptide (TPR) repeat protein
MTIELRLCGPPSWVVDGRSMPWTPSGPRALLTLLASQPTWWTREALTAVFRPETAEAEALRYVRQLIHRARVLVDDTRCEPVLGRSERQAPGLEIDRDRVRWHVVSDVAWFRQAAAAGDAAALERPVAAFLAGWRPPGAGFARWCEAERSELIRIRRQLARDLCLARAAAGDGSGAADAAEVLLEDDPLDEATVADVMRWRLESGDASAGLAAFETFRQQLAAEIGADPGSTVRALADDLREVARGRRPRAPADGANGGPASLKSSSPGLLLGRDEELARLAASLEDGGPTAVALVGLGGSGKTRLVLEAARRARATGVEVAFVSLAGMNAADQVADRVAAALPVSWNVVDSEERWHVWLARGRVLTVLDEAENVAGLDAWWAKVAPEFGDARLWITTRIAPRWTAVAVWPLGGVEVPPADAPRSAQRRCAAVRLLLELAGFDPDQVSDLDVSWASDVARHVGGHPLALELLAASIRGIPPSVAFGEHGVSSLALRTDTVDVAPAHRDLEGILADAWANLPSAMRHAARRLTLIRGPFDLSAARDLTQLDAPDLSRLLDRALLQRVGIDRFDVHALVRRSAPPHESVDHDAHARWALGRVAVRGRALRSDAHVAAIGEIVALAEDTRAAWSHAVTELGAGRTDLLPLLDAALDPLDHAWHASGRLGAAAAAYAEALGALGRPESLRHVRDVLAWWCRVVVRASAAERNLGRPEAGIERLDAIVGRRVDADAEQRLEARLELAKCHHRLGRLRLAERLYRAVLRDPSSRRRPDIASATHTGLAQLLWTTARDVDEAMEHDDAALVEARRDGDPDALVIALINAGASAFELGRIEDAEGRWREAAALAATLGHQAREAAIWNNLGLAASRRGEASAARAAFERSLALRRSTADVLGQATVRLHLGQFEAHHGRDLQAANGHLEASIAGFAQAGDGEGQALALAAWSELASATGDARRAEGRALRSLAFAREAASVRASLTAGLALARAWAASEDRASAATLAGWLAELAREREEGVRATALELAASTGGEAPPPPAWPPVGGELTGLVDAILAGQVRATASSWNETGTLHR